jgi:hypothetical protein
MNSDALTARDRFVPAPRAGRIDHEVIWGSIAFGILIAARVVPIEFLHHIAGACPLKTATGIPCFLCGGTHAMIALTRGDWAAAWSLNPLAAAIGLAAVLYTIYAACAILSRKRWRPRIANPRRLVTAVMTTLALAAIANWCYLIHTGR